MWQAQYTELPGGAAARVAAAGPQRAVVWQAQYTEPPGGAAHRASWRSCGARGRRCPAAAFRVAGAVHRASWRRCGARGRRSPGRAVVWQAQYTEHPGGAAARVAAAGRGWLSSGSALHRASWRSCGARCRCWPAAGCRAVRRSCCARARRWPAAGFRVAGAVHRASWTCGARVAAAGPRRSVVLQAQYTEPPEEAAARVAVTHTHTLFFTHHPVTHTVFHTPSFTPLCQTPSFTFHL